MGLKQYTVRGPDTWGPMLDALIPVVRSSSPYGAALGELTRSTVLRVVVDEGLRALGAAASVPVETDPRQATLFEDGGAE